MSATDILRKLKRDTDTTIKSLAAFNETLGELMPRVEEIENLETRAAAAKFQFDDLTRRYRETEGALQEAQREYAQISAQLSGPLTQAHELRTQLRDWETKR
jgi:chromosome segregation ATPase